MSRLVARLALTHGRDALRSRWILVYGGTFLMLTEGLLRFSGGDAKAILSLATASLMIIPLATLVIATIYVYNAREFTELLLAQPIRRSAMYTGLYLGLALPMTLGFVGGVGLPFLARGGGESGQHGAVLMLLAVGAALTLAFTAIAFCIALRADDRLRGVGVALGLWLVLSILYDGAVLMLVALFSDYPIERPLVGLMLVNPVDLGRVLMLLQLDVAALMGYTGAVFERFFGVGGTALAAGVLTLWIAGPVALGARQFARKDF